MANTSNTPPCLSRFVSFIYIPLLSFLQRSQGGHHVSNTASSSSSPSPTLQCWWLSQHPPPLDKVERLSGDSSSTTCRGGSSRCPQPQHVEGGGGGALAKGLIMSPRFGLQERPPTHTPCPSSPHNRSHLANRDNGLSTALTKSNNCHKRGVSPHTHQSPQPHRSPRGQAFASPTAAGDG